MPDRRTALGLLGAALIAPARVFALPFDPQAQRRGVLALAQAQFDRLGDQVARRDFVAVVDFTLPSALPRFHLADMTTGRVTSLLVAHGKGSDPQHDGFLKRFSNEPGSMASSRGAYLTQGPYQGKYGPSLRLAGLDPDNSNAAARALVMHPAWYAEPAMLARWGKLGRSDGCFALSPADFAYALSALGSGRLIYADRLGLG